MRIMHTSPAWLLGLLVAAAVLLLSAVQAEAAHTKHQTPNAAGAVEVTDPKLARVLEEATAAAGKPRLFHEHLVHDRQLVQPDNW
jgi:predicted outer membrane lipoprotein